MYPFLTSALDADWWLASGPGSLPPVKEKLEPSELGLNVLENRKIFCPCREP